MYKENILNPFNKAKINEKSIIYLVGALLPSVFIAKSFEAILIYIGFLLIFLILSTLISWLINKVVAEEIQILVYIISLFAISISLNLLAKGFFLNFQNEFGLYIYILAINPLPYMLFERVKEENFKNTFVDSLATTLGAAIVLILVSLLREILGTGTLSFGKYSSFSLKVIDFKFGKYAISILTEPAGGLILFGLLLAIILGVANKLNRKEEIK